MAKKTMKVDKSSTSNVLVFDSNMRKTLVEGVLQDIKGYIESSTDGAVEVSYEDFNLKNHEFGFKLYAARGDACKKQTFIEAENAIVNAMSYMFLGDNEQYDVSIASEDKELEVQIVSNW